MILQSRRRPGRPLVTQRVTDRRSLVLLLSVMLLGGCNEAEGIDPPVPLFGEVPIIYPISLWDADIEGEALVRVLVNDLGGVDSVEVVESSGYAAFDSASVRGAREIRFQPARRGEERVTVWAQVPVHFSKRPRPDIVP